MPFACEMRGGRPRLSPGPERGYPIIGGREERTFKACSPANPGLCRQWTVYRFDLDCDGERVSWVEVVAAASVSRRLARLVDGRLEVRMHPRWNLPHDDPCAYDSGDDPFGDRPRRRRCAERLARMPPAVVEMPRGFAPKLGIDAIFVGARFAKAPPREPPPEDVDAGAEQSQPDPSAEPPPSKPAGEATAKRTPPEAAPPPPPTPPARGDQEAHAKAKPPAPPPPPPAKEPATQKEVAALSPPATNPPPASPPPPPSSTPPPPGTPPAPKEATAQSPPPQAPLPKSPPQPETKPAAKAAPAPPEPKREAPAQPPPPVEAPERADKGAWPSLLGFTALRTPAMGVIVAFTGLTLGLLIAFAAARRRERLQHAAGTRQRTRSAPRLGFDDSSGTGGADTPLGPPLERIPGASAADAALAAWGSRVPQTRKEAIQALGIGARRGSTDVAAVKRIVDALRRHWHPDRATDEADRGLREQRSKQINAAWDLLQGERADA